MDSKELRTLTDEDLEQCKAFISRLNDNEALAPHEIKKLAGFLESTLADFEILADVHDATVAHSTVLENELEDKNNESEILLAKMKKYLSPQLFKLIVGGDVDASTDNYRRKNMPVFFSDIVGFTDLTDQIEAEALSSLLNSYLNKMTEIALKWGGTIDKFIGDAVMIFFEEDNTKDCVARCVQMAIEMQTAMINLRKLWQQQGITNNLKIRIGVNTGYCTIGNFGSDERMDYTIVGGTVNTASRLESNCTPGSILISSSTYGFVQDIIEVEPKGSIKVKGVSHPIETFEVTGLKEPLQQKCTFLSESNNGFKLQSINYSANEVSPLEKEAIINSLEKALKKIRQQ
ncbi:MAG: adenylate/guanylate cyclase domain-containing protein [Pseudomonadales bacterium]|nr:adenylate/guanylate cyclase domain-containing protein [Pseudomonadales bacterium]